MMANSAIKWTISALFLFSVIQAKEPGQVTPNSGTGFDAGPPISEEEKAVGKEKYANQTYRPQDLKKRDESEPPASSTEGPGGRNVLRDVSKRWPNSVVPYTIEAAFTAEERTIIAAGIANIEDNTCVRLRQKQDTDEDWIEIFRTGASGCWAILGFIGPGNGAHKVSLEPAQFEGDGSCIWKGTVVHELLHILGFAHEQSRGDRDDYITIDWTNIGLDKAAQLWKGTEAGSGENLPACTTEGAVEGDSFDNCVGFGVYTTFGLPYDFQSVMHYGLRSFATDSSKNVMTPKDSSITDIGNTELSELDKQKVKRAYFCDATAQSKCGGYYNGTGGTLSGVGGSGEKECETILSSTPDKIIVLDATATFSGTCDTDYLEVRQGNQLDGALVGKYCVDNPLPNPLNTESNPVILIWKTTTSTLTGSWRAIEAVCCDSVTLSSTDPGWTSDGWYMANLEGDYQLHPTTPMKRGRKVYQRGDYCIYLNPRSQFMVGDCSDLDSNAGYVLAHSDLLCAQYVKNWKYYDGNGFVADSTMRVTCKGAQPTIPPPTTATSTTTASPGGSNDCCQRREVDGIEYTFTEVDTISTLPEYNCLDNCVYKKNMADADRFCFKSGSLGAKCLDGR